MVISIAGITAFQSFLPQSAGQSTLNMNNMLSGNLLLLLKSLFRLLRSSRKPYCQLENKPLSLQVVYRDLAEEFASLYVHDVQHSRMGPLLQAVDDKLGSLCSTAEMEVHSLLAQILLQTTLDAIIRVLLHGGPNRRDTQPAYRVPTRNLGTRLPPCSALPYTMATQNSCKVY